jgi:hypothetical protein
VSHECKIYKAEDDNLTFDPIDKAESQSGRLIAYLTNSANIIATEEKKSQFYLKPEAENDLLLPKDGQSETFMIVRSLKNKDGKQKGYMLQPGDIVKLGRIE